MAAAAQIDSVDRILGAVREVLGPAETPIALHEPEFRGHERDYVLECIDSGWVSSAGSYVDRIERDLAKITGVRRVVAVANGTAALHVCLKLAGAGPGDEVLTPTLTFIATANAVSYTGATPHFVDCEATALGVDATKLDAYLGEIAELRDDVCVNRHSGRPIRALVVMHVFGHPADLDSLAEVCELRNIVLVEDAAESLGSFYRGVHTGNRGLVSALSFNGNKLVTTGGGGAILTNDVALGERAKHLTTTARVKHRWNFIHDEIGYNYRMPNLNAALGCAQLERLPDMLRRKRELATRYAAAFRRVPDAAFLTEPDRCESNCWLNAIVLSPERAAERDAVLDRLNDAGYRARPIWTLMHRLPMYANCPRGDLSVAEDMVSRVINLPSSPALVG